jgi:hypothetical protein
MMDMVILSQLIMQQHEVLELTIRVDAERALEAKMEMLKAGMVVVDAAQSEQDPNQVVIKFWQDKDVPRETPFGEGRI